MEDGFKETEIAKQLGRTPSWVSERLSELRTEILLQNGLLPPLTDSERASLHDSIRRYGQLVPILVTTQLKLIDGSNRLSILDELGQEARYQILEGLTTDDEWELAVTLNASRRSMTRQQKRKLVEHELMRDAERSDRRIAAMCGVAAGTVGATRREIDEQQQQLRQQGLGPAPALPAATDTDDVSKLHTSPTVKAPEPPARPPPAARRTDTLGRRQPARRTPRPLTDRTIAHAACPCCGQPANVIRHGTHTRIEHA